jgi:hypothetical protein
MWKPTPEQLHNVDLFIASAERKKREFRDLARCREIMFGVNPLEDEENTITKHKPKTASIPPHQCKVDHYTTTDQDGRTWMVEHRH